MVVWCPCALVQGISPDLKTPDSEPDSGRNQKGNHTVIKQEIDGTVLVQEVSSEPKSSVSEPISGNNEPKTKQENQEPIDAQSENQ